LAAGPEYLLYEHYIVSGTLSQDHVTAWLIETMALVYVIVPIAVGTALAYLSRPEPATAAKPPGDGAPQLPATKLKWRTRAWRWLRAAGGAVVRASGRAIRPVARWAIGDQVEPRAWDWTWQPSINAVVRAKLKSGTWVAGFWGRYQSTVTGRAFRRSYASGYPEDGELYLGVGFEIDPASGVLVRDSNDRPVPVEGERGLLLRWSEVEYLDIQEF
jgi:hypothetical protein